MGEMSQLQEADVGMTWYDRTTLLTHFIHNKGFILGVLVYDQAHIGEMR